MKLLHKQTIKTKSIRNDAISSKTQGKSERITKSLEKPESSDKIGESNIHERWQPPKCKLCEKKFSQETDLNTHIANVHQAILELTKNEKRSFECEICNYRYIAKSKLEAHISSVHEGKKPFKCECCDQSFAQKSKMKRDILSIHEERKPFNYEYCDKSFKQKQHLSSHIRYVHEKEKPFMCDFC